MIEYRSEFNETVKSLCKVLPLCFEAEDGQRYWYGGTVELLFKMVGFLGVTNNEATKKVPHTDKMWEEK